MITGKDAAHLQLAIMSAQSFFNQTYPSKVLVVINDGSSYQLAPLLNNPCLIELIVPPPPEGSSYYASERLTLGQLRNIGLEAIPRLAVWVQWDDDGGCHAVESWPRVSR